jgi:hypothetical protein
MKRTGNGDYAGEMFIFNILLKTSNSKVKQKNRVTILLGNPVTVILAASYQFKRSVATRPCFSTGQA